MENETKMNAPKPLTPIKMEKINQLVSSEEFLFGSGNKRAEMIANFISTLEQSEESKCDDTLDENYSACSLPSQKSEVKPLSEIAVLFAEWIKTHAKYCEPDGWKDENGLGETISSKDLYLKFLNTTAF